MIGEREIDRITDHRLQSAVIAARYVEASAAILQCALVGNSTVEEIEKHVNDVLRGLAQVNVYVTEKKEGTSEERVMKALENLRTTAAGMAKR